MGTTLAHRSSSLFVAPSGCSSGEHTTEAHLDAKELSTLQGLVIDPAHVLLVVCIKLLIGPPRLPLDEMRVLYAVRRRPAGCMTTSVGEPPCTTKVGGLPRRAHAQKSPLVSLIRLWSCCLETTGLLSSPSVFCLFTRSRLCHLFRKQSTQHEGPQGGETRGVIRMAGDNS